jgi:hypothetical protein
MKVNGYELREAIKRWTLKRDSLLSQFPEVLTKFPGDMVPTPGEVAAQLLEAERAICQLQGAQQVYNNGATVKLADGQVVTVSVAVKYQGGLARLEKLWKSAGVAHKHYSYESPRTTRDPNMVHAERQVSYQEATNQALAIARQIGDLKIAVAEANAVPRELDLEPRLFEG